MKIRVSGLTNKSQKTLAQKMTLEELVLMASIHMDVVSGKMTIEQYRYKENELIEKYGFKVK